MSVVSCDASTGPGAAGLIGSGHSLPASGHSLSLTYAAVAASPPRRRSPTPPPSGEWTWSTNGSGEPCKIWRQPRPAGPEVTPPPPPSPPCLDLTPPPLPTLPYPLLPPPPLPTLPYPLLPPPPPPIADCPPSPSGVSPAPPMLGSPRGVLPAPPMFEPPRGVSPAPPMFGSPKGVSPHLSPQSNFPSGDSLIASDPLVAGCDESPASRTLSKAEKRAERWKNFVAGCVESPASRTLSKAEKRAKKWKDFKQNSKKQRVADASHSPLHHPSGGGRSAVFERQLQRLKGFFGLGGPARGAAPAVGAGRRASAPASARGLPLVVSPGSPLHPAPQAAPAVSPGSPLHPAPQAAPAAPVVSPGPPLHPALQAAPVVSPGSPLHPAPQASPVPSVVSPGSPLHPALQAAPVGFPGSPLHPAPQAAPAPPVVTPGSPLQAVPTSPVVSPGSSLNPAPQASPVVTPGSPLHPAPQAAPAPPACSTLPVTDALSSSPPPSRSPSPPSGPAAVPPYLLEDAATDMGTSRVASNLAQVCAEPAAARAPATTTHRTLVVNPAATPGGKLLVNPAAVASPAPPAANTVVKDSPAPPAASTVVKPSPAPLAASTVVKASPAPLAASTVVKASPVVPTTATSTVVKASPAPPVASTVVKASPVVRTTANSTVVKASPALPATSTVVKASPAPPTTSTLVVASPAPPATSTVVKASPSPPAASTMVKASPVSTAAVAPTLVDLTVDEPIPDPPSAASSGKPKPPTPPAAAPPAPSALKMGVKQRRRGRARRALAEILNMREPQKPASHAATPASSSGQVFVFTATDAANKARATASATASASADPNAGPNNKKRPAEDPAGEGYTVEDSPLEDANNNDTTKDGNAVTLQDDAEGTVDAVVQAPKRARVDVIDVPLDDAIQKLRQSGAQLIYRTGQPLPLRVSWTMSPPPPRNAWDHDGVEYRPLDDLDPETRSEYEDISDAFQMSCKNKGFRVKRVSRVRNDQLLHLFQRQVSELEAECGDVAVLRMYHGTRRDKVDSICHNNLDLGMAGVGSNHFWWGRGVNFSPISYYSSHYSDQAPYRSMIVFDVVVGRVFSKPHIRQVPPLPEDADRLYDTNMKLQPAPQVVVKFNAHSFYPAYVVDYEAPPNGHRGAKGKVVGAPSSYYYQPQPQCWWPWWGPQPPEWVPHNRPRAFNVNGDHNGNYRSGLLSASNGNLNGNFNRNFNGSSNGNSVWNADENFSGSNENVFVFRGNNDYGSNENAFVFHGNNNYGSNENVFVFHGTNNNCNSNGHGNNENYSSNGYGNQVGNVRDSGYWRNNLDGNLPNSHQNAFCSNGQSFGHNGQFNFSKPMPGYVFDNYGSCGNYGDYRWN